jgi:uncharacterized protein
MMAAVLMLGCEEHKVGGMTVEQEFPDSKVAALARSACDGDLDAVNSALKRGADPNGKGKDGATPIFWAMACENARGVEALLKAGADPNYRLPAGDTPVTVAAGIKSPDILKLLLKYHGDPNATNDRRPYVAGNALANALSVGIYGYGWDNYYALLDAGADINKATDVGETIATAAASLGAFDKVAELLKRGYDYDLVELGGLVQNPNIGNPSERAEVIKMLQARGVKFPIPPLIKLYSGRVQMTADRVLHVVWARGRTAGGKIVKAHFQTIKPGDPDYDNLLKRVGGLKPGYGVGIPRLPNDPVPIAR